MHRLLLSYDGDVILVKASPSEFLSRKTALGRSSLRQSLPLITFIHILREDWRVLVSPTTEFVGHEVISGSDCPPCIIHVPGPQIGLVNGCWFLDLRWNCACDLAPIGADRE